MTSFELNGMRPLCFIGSRRWRGFDRFEVLCCLMKALALYHRIAIQPSLATLLSIAAGCL